MPHGTDVPLKIMCITGLFPAKSLEWWKKDQGFTHPRRLNPRGLSVYAATSKTLDLFDDRPGQFNAFEFRPAHIGFGEIGLLEVSPAQIRLA